MLVLLKICCLPNPTSACEPLKEIHVDALSTQSVIQFSGISHKNSRQALTS